jgi:6-pyruvoyltetrahydropterin/6-carboxytetrahydropterin synthase
MVYQSTKLYGHELGLSAVFRQWRADSHCNLLHGYSLAFKFTFEAAELDDRNWVMDFGGLKGLKTALHESFDHKLVLAEDDPEFDLLAGLQLAGLAEITVVPAVGCEKFAEYAYNLAASYLESQNLSQRVRVVEVECKEHGSNSAIYKP